MMQVKLAKMALALSVLAISSGSALAASCPALRWTTLGTAGGPVPTAERSEPANLLTIGERRILVDTGDGTVDQLARIGLDLGAVDTVFISHNHLDHTGGLAAVIGLRWMNQFPGVLTVYGPVGTRAVVEGIVASLATPGSIGFGLGTPPPRPADSVRVVELAGGQALDLGQGASVKTAANSHFDHDGKPDPANVSLSYRFALGPRSITYTGDTGPSAAVTTLAKGSDMFVTEIIALDALLGEIRARRKDASPEMLAGMERHLSTHHLKPEAIGEIAAQAGVGRVVLTHFAVPPGPLPQYEPSIRTGIAARYAGPVDLARDLQSFDVGCRP
ncbi:MBL fold metallo-hydrolase [Novosphingobium sp.]|jgi:ribonuclease BN (tRNA processing enzyme)|uniref:MBL fold metallo-hydrolase n=1 Tax=Novosphingobium sp. TaxID=1874826 RepID=UPI002FE05413